MSITSEIERINTNISNAYTELENKGATIPELKNSNNLASTIATVSSGASINGKLEQKVCSGSVSKGDLVCVNHLKDTLIDTLDDIVTASLNLSTSSNIIDGNLETYCTCSRTLNNTASLYFRMPTYDKFGITQETIITKFGVKFIYTNAIDISIGFNASLWKDFSTHTSLIPLHSIPATSISGDSNLKRESGIEYSTKFKASQLPNYGGRMYLSSGSGGNTYNLYGIKTYIEYIDNGVIKTATSTTDIITGVANSDGTDGSTIDVYVPNVE